MKTKSRYSWAKIRAVKTDKPTRPTTGWWFSETIQSNSLFSKQKNSNPAQPTTGWRVKRVHLI